MALFNGWLIVPCPGTPSAPRSIEISIYTAASVNISPFTSQQQIYDWNVQTLEGSVSLPPLPYPTGQEWVAFLKALKGPVNVFQFSAAFMAAYPNDVSSSLYWRLKANSVKYSIAENRYYGFQFEFRQAL